MWLPGNEGGKTMDTFTVDALSDAIGGAEGDRTPDLMAASLKPLVLCPDSFCID